MEKYKISLVTLIFVLMMAASVFGQAKYKTPLDAAAGMTGRTKESIVEESMNTNKTLADIMYEAELLTAFENELIAQSKITVNERVVSNKMTKEDATNVINAMDNKTDNYWNHIGFTGGCYSGQNCHDGSMHGHVEYNNYNDNVYKHNGYCGSDGTYSYNENHYNNQQSNSHNNTNRHNKNTTTKTNNRSSSRRSCCN